jgi:hypothetical protein
LLLAAGVLAFGRAAQNQKQVTFPTITSYALDKQKITLPGEMEGETDLLIISFEPEQEKDVQSWLPVAQGLQHSNFKFRYYELPVNAKENFVFRWWDTSSMRSDETDPVMWHWIVPLFVDRQDFRKQLDIPNLKQVVVMLVDRQGHVLWRASGAMSEDKRASLLAAAGQQH